jgi:indole-3-glycerol phosphate synthase
MNILEEIIANKRVEVEAFKKARSTNGLRSAAERRGCAPDFIAALRSAPIGLIAEAKRRSPSAGTIREPFDPRAIAAAYDKAGAQAISVLMDRQYFGGGDFDFQTVRATVDLPLLYKEFVIDAWQIWHAASLGASAVLLIAAALDDAQLMEFVALCRKARVEPLVEVHDENEMERIAAMPVRCVGVNHRDLKTFNVSLETTLRLESLAPRGCTLISESGIRSADDVRRLRDAGVHAVLVGEHFLRQPDLNKAVRDLMEL